MKNKKLEQILTGVTNEVKEKLRKSNENYQKQLRANISDSINYSQIEMINDLYYVLSNGNYSTIKKIGAYQNIRPAGWKVIGKEVFFRYSLAKETPTRVTRIVLDSIRDNMNTDFRTVSNVLFSNMGCQANMLYPYLMAGITIHHIVDFEADIVIICSVNKALFNF
ncbi:hypothetical protein ACTQ1L_05620 [Agathobacter sp. LCP21S3_B2]|uniref:hypothetical protein n=1 Tax=Agathobacter sp. LCP21S3_B2 TaxID=3438734 RepID=UPI003F9175F9